MIQSQCDVKHESKPRRKISSINHLLACIDRKIRMCICELLQEYHLVISREGQGSFFGTIGGAIRDLDPSKAKYREAEKPPKEKSNFKVNPSKRGTGYGYVFIHSLLFRSFFSLQLCQYGYWSRSTLRIQRQNR